MGQDQELVELLWGNGQVVMQGQNQKKQLGGCKESKYNLRIKENEGASLEKNEIVRTHQSLTPGDETAPWLHSVLDDPFDELCSNFFDEIPTAVAAAAARIRNEAPEREKTVKQCISVAVTKAQEGKAGNLPKKNVDELKFACSSSSHSNLVGCSAGNHAAPMMLRPKGHLTVDTKSSSLHQDASKLVNFSHFSRATMVSMANPDPTCEAVGYKSKNPIVKSIGKPSVSPNGSNNYEKDQNQMQFYPSLISTESMDNVLFVENDAPRGRLTSGEEGQVAGDVLEGTSSSAASGSSTGKFGEQITCKNSQKRKVRDVEESDCHSEGIEYESVETRRLPTKSVSSRRSRAAEVHNLSERRRRDRINEKMKALQELIPHCNKSDKASMLDEAIEYLKSLQLQVQIMWMGGGMTPYIFPGIQHYLSPLAVSHATRPSSHGSMPLPEIPLVDQSRTTLVGSDQFTQCSLSVNPMQVSEMNLQEYYPRQLSIQQLHMASQMMQQNQRIHETLGGTSVSRDAGIRRENSQFYKSD